MKRYHLKLIYYFVLILNLSFLTACTIKDSYNNPIIKQINIDNFTPSSTFIINRTENNTIPKTTTSNGNLYIITDANGKGWNLSPGDIIEYSFQKETNNQQQLLIGHIQNGIVDFGTVYKDLSGIYTYEIKESGLYYLYIINVSSDEISLIEGSVNITSCEKASGDCVSVFVK